MSVKRLLIAIVISSVVTFIPAFILEQPSDSGAMGTMRMVLSALGVPGFIVGFIVSGQNINDVNFVIVELTNFVFYGGLSYFVLAIWARHHAGHKSKV